MLRKNTVGSWLIMTIVLLFMSGCGTKTISTSSIDNNTPSLAISNSSNNTPSSAISTNPVNFDDSKEKGYIYQSSDEAMFITWTEDSSNKIVGQLQITVLTNTGIQSSNHPFNGVINGSNISITIIGSVWTDGLANKVFTGALNGDSQLTLLLPASNGMMTSLPFTSGKVNDFNNIVKTFNNTYTTNQNASKEVAQQQALQEKRWKIIQNLTNSYNALKQNMSSLNSYDFSKDIATMRQHYEKMQNDYSKLKKDASVTPLTYQQLNGVVYQDLNGAMYQDLNGALYQDLNGSIYQDIQNLKSAISTVNSDISDMQANYQAYKDYGITGSFTDEIITDVITKAQNNVKAANNKVTATQQQANEIYKQGEQLYQAAQQYYSSLKSAD